MGGQAWLSEVTCRCPEVTQAAVAGEFYVFDTADPDGPVVQLPDYDLIGRRCHGGAVPDPGPLTAAGKGKGAGGAQHGKGVLALPYAAAEQPALAVAPLWMDRSWVPPGRRRHGRILTFRDDYARPVGWVTIWDGGSDVHFTLAALDRPLTDLFRRNPRGLRNQWVWCRVLYRDNGHHRFSQELGILPDGVEIDDDDEE